MTDDRLSGAGDPDSIAKVVGTTSAYLNAVDCSNADASFCANLNRNDCQKTANTCGACLDGFYGVDGDSNNACLAVPTRRRLTSITCLNDCSSQGTCGFLNIDSHESLASCDAGDASCIAVCTCDSGFFGPDCSYTQADLEGAQGNRVTLISALHDQIALQTADATTVKSWIASLNSNTQKPEQLNDDAIALVNDMLSTIMGALSSSGIAVDDADDVLLSVDRVAQIYAGLSNVITTPTITADVVSERVALLDTYTKFVSSSMAAGQAAISNIQSLFRVLSVVKSLNNGGTTILTSLVEPLSVGEIADDVKANEVVVPLDSVSGSDVAELNMIVTRAVLYDNIDDMNSNPVRLNVRNLPCSLTSAGCDAVVNLQNYRFVFVHTTEDLEFSGLNYSYTCPSGDHSVHDLFCTDDFNASYTCNNAGKGFTRCPFFRNVSTCDAISGLDAVEGNCSWVSNGHLNATCQCGLSSSAVTSSDYFTKDYVSVLGVVPQGFEQDFSSNSSSSSLGAGEISAIVIAGLAFLGFLVFTGMYVLKKMKDHGIQKDQYAQYKRDVAEKKAASEAAKKVTLSPRENVPVQGDSALNYAPPHLPSAIENPFAPHSPQRYIIKDDVEEQVSCSEAHLSNVLVLRNEEYDLSGEAYLGESSSSSANQAPPVVEPSSKCCGMTIRSGANQTTLPPQPPVALEQPDKENPLAMALILSSEEGEL